MFLAVRDSQKVLMLKWFSALYLSVITSRKPKIAVFFRFPHDLKEQKRWEKLIRRADKGPTSSSRVCSCHFRNGDKTNGPTIFKRNASKLFPKKKKTRKQKFEHQRKHRAMMIFKCKEPNKGTQKCTMN